MESKSVPSAAEVLPKAKDLTAENFGVMVNASVGKLVEKGWRDGDKSGSHMFESDDGTIRLPFLAGKNGRLQPRCRLARLLGRQGAIEAMLDDPDVHSVSWLADQPELASAEGRSIAIDLIKQVAGELERRESARAATGSLSTAELERLLRERRKGC